MKMKKRHTLMGFIAIIFWSTAVAVIRSFTENVGPITAAAAVYLLGGAVGVFILVFQSKLASSLRSFDKRYLFICGGLFVLYMGSFYAALGMAANHSQAIEIGLINYLWPILTVIFSILILKTRSTILIIPGTMVAFGGIYIVTTQDHPFLWSEFISNIVTNPLVYILGLIAAISWGMYSVLSRKYGQQSQDNVIAVFMLVTGLLLGITSLFVDEKSKWTLSGFWELLYLAISTNLAYTFWDKAMRHGDIILVASVSYLLPFFSVLVASLYLSAPLSINLIIGAILVVIGAILSKSSIRA